MPGLIRPINSRLQLHKQIFREILGARPLTGPQAPLLPRGKLKGLSALWAGICTLHKCIHIVANVFVQVTTYTDTYIFEVYGFHSQVLYKYLFMLQTVGPHRFMHISIRTRICIFELYCGLYHITVGLTDTHIVYVQHVYPYQCSTTDIIVPHDFWSYGVNWHL